MTYFEIQSIKLNKKIIDFLKLARKEISEFFDIELRLPVVFFLNSRKQIDQIWQKKTEDWLVGWSTDNNIFILNPKIYTKESSHKDIASFWKTLKHEYIHIAYREFCWHNRPKWLSEGLACYLAGQVKKTPDNKTALKIFDYFQKSDWQIYDIGYFWVELLIRKFGKGKLLKLIKEIDFKTTKGQFGRKFKKIYGFNYNKKELKDIYALYPMSKTK